MAIEFIQEDGTGLSNSTSYISVAYFRQYWENRGTDFSSTPDETIKAWLNVASEHIDITWTFYGTKAVATQALEFPRSDLYDKNGDSILSTIVPPDIEKATAELAKDYYENDTLNPEQAIKTRAIGDVTLEYKDGVTPKINVNAMKYLKPYIYFNGNSRKVVRV